MKEEPFADAHILIVDDEPTNIELLQSVLKVGGYLHCLSTGDPRQVLPIYRQFHPDLIILDVMMPHLDGYAVLQQIASRVARNDYLPILMLTADVSTEARQKCLSMGAKDFLTKPIDVTEVLLRIRNLLETRFLHLRLIEQNRRLEEELQERTGEVWEAHLETLRCLALAAEYRDDSTGEHPRRVGATSAILARAIGLPDDTADLIRLAASLHDIGKIGISEAILRSSQKLTAAESEEMKTHTTIGGKILSGTKVPLLQMAEEIALYHHERWDGDGYARLREAATPITARIVAIADAFDVLTHERPYKSACSTEEASAEIERQSGHQFDPDLVKVFLEWRKREELPRSGVLRQAVR